ncbi:acyl carrier protein [Paenibacillus sp. 1P07SE]|uniref:acyl carrier protein n=1 Tax=Paenibacillus sp. 1P07SE TaxID=3132209 RepID=UPI0039A6FB00
MNRELRQQVGELLAGVLEIPLQADDNPQRRLLDSWDSLKHMELILSLEETFNIRFTSQEVAVIESLDDLVRIVEVKV